MPPPPEDQEDTNREVVVVEVAAVDTLSLNKEVYIIIC